MKAFQKSSFTCFLLMLVFLCSSSELFAASGTQWTTHANDIVIKGNSQWIGMGQGGYHPVRMSIQNSGAACNLTIQFSSDYGYSKQPTVSRTIHVEQNETARFTLLIPLVSTGTNGVIKVLRNGRLLKVHQKGFSLAEVDYSTGDYPALLVISPKKIDFTEYESLLVSLSSSSSGRSYPSTISADEQCLVIEPTMLPENWLAYSGVDIVAVPLETLNKMSRDARTAILQWVETGGTLIVYNVNSAINTSSQLIDVTHLKQHNHSTLSWITLLTNKRRLINRFTEEEVDHDPYSSKPVEAETATKKTKRTEKFTWKNKPSDIGYRPYMQGTLFAFQKNPFEGTMQDWGWLLKTLGKNKYSWRQRHGVAPRGRNSDFLMFLIPGISGVPVIPFLLLISIFTIIIGPLNYFFLMKKKQLYLLVLTIPVIAFITSFSLLGYSMIAHGFGVKSRVRSVTVLNQNNNTAVSTARVSLFAGITPSGGLKFSPNTAVYPIWKSQNEFTSGTVNWSDHQSLTSGWIRSRTNTQFLIKEHRTERGRLNIKNQTNHKLEIGNGLEWDIEAILVVDEKGTLFEGGELDAGASTQLLPAKNIQKFTKLLSRFPLNFPEGIDNHRSYNPLGMGYRGYPYYGEMPENSFSTSQMEMSIRNLNTIDRRLKQNKVQSLDIRKTYYAILKQNPGIGIGIEGTTERAGYHLLIGYY